MKRFILKRFFQSIVLLLGITFIVFVMVRVTGDPILLFLPPQASDEDIQTIREHLGLADSWPVQYWKFLSNALRGDFGKSIKWNAPSMSFVLQRFPATALLALFAMLWGLIIAIPIGVLSAVKKGTVFDSMGKILGLIGQSMPTFWIGLLLILVFAMNLGWFPSSGMEGFSSLILPSFALSCFVAASIMRVTRSSLLDVLDAEYIKLLRIKGLSERYILLRHAFKNAAIPIVTITGLQLATILRGAVVTETVFAWPGVGKMAVDAVLSRDFPLVQASVLFMAVIFISVNFLVDVAYAYLDPRIRYQ